MFNPINFTINNFKPEVVSGIGGYTHMWKCRCGMHINFHIYENQTKRGEGTFTATSNFHNKGFYEKTLSYGQTLVCPKCGYELELDGEKAPADTLLQMKYQNNWINPISIKSYEYDGKPWFKVSIQTCERVNISKDDVHDDMRIINGMVYEYYCLDLERGKFYRSHAVGFDSMGRRLKRPTRFINQAAKAMHYDHPKEYSFEGALYADKRPNIFEYFSKDGVQVANRSKHISYSHDAFALYYYIVNIINGYNKNIYGKAYFPLCVVEDKDDAYFDLYENASFSNGKKTDESFEIKNRNKMIDAVLRYPMLPNHFRYPLCNERLTHSNVCKLRRSSTNIPKVREVLGFSKSLVKTIANTNESVGIATTLTSIIEKNKKSQALKLIFNAWGETHFINRVLLKDRSRTLQDTITMLEMIMKDAGISTIDQIYDKEGPMFKLMREGFAGNLTELHDKLAQAVSLLNYRAQKLISYEESVKMQYSKDELSIIAPEHSNELVACGNILSICVGSYVDAVQNNRCKIFFVKKDDRFLACLEVVTLDSISRYPWENTPAIKSTTGKEIYVLQQAKLKYNAAAGTDPVIRQFILDWCEENDIKVKDSLWDMQERQETDEFTRQRRKENVELHYELMDDYSKTTAQMFIVSAAAFLSNIGMTSGCVYNTIKRCMKTTNEIKQPELDALPW